jgi:dinuclear metal center YbgI/SA1388 family protein
MNNPTPLSELVTTLDTLLRTREIEDYPRALNGLQVENGGAIIRIIAAVDACESVIREASSVRGTLLLVHHGLFWNGVQRITGAFHRKLRAAIEGDLALYSSHLPLDLHPQLGNNVLLARALGLTRLKPAFVLKGHPVGMGGSIRALSREALKAKISEVVGGSVHLAPGGSEAIRSVLVVSGGAGGEVARVAELGADAFDAFVTGEGPHWSYTAAEELGINLYYAGHYATETFGVKALAAHLGRKTGLPWSFLDHPTGL